MCCSSSGLAANLRCMYNMIQCECGEQEKPIDRVCRPRRHPICCCSGHWTSSIILIAELKLNQTTTSRGMAGNWLTAIKVCCAQQKDCEHYAKKVHIHSPVHIQSSSIVLVECGCPFVTVFHLRSPLLPFLLAHHLISSDNNKIIMDMTAREDRGDSRRGCGEYSGKTLNLMQCNSAGIHT